MNSQKTKTTFVRKGCGDYKAVDKEDKSAAQERKLLSWSLFIDLELNTLYTLFLCGYPSSA